MRKILQLFILIALPAGFCSAQSFEWARQIGGTSNDFLFDAATDGAGNIYATGTFFSTVDFDPGPGVHNLTSSSADAYAVKLDVNGNFLWARSFSGTSSDYSRGRKLKTDASGNVYVMGLFQGTVDFDPGAAVHTMTSQSGIADLFVVKLDASGNFVWAIQRQSANTTLPIVASCDLEADAANNLYMTYSFGLSNSPEVVIEKANSTGTSIWAKTINASGGVSGSYLADNRLAIDGSGNIFVSGTFNGEVNFDPNGTYMLQAQAGTNAFVLKLTNAGSFAWVKNFESNPGFSVGSDIVTDAGGNIFLGGRFQGIVDFDPGTGVHNVTSGASSPGWSIYVLKLSSSGNFAWVNDYGSGTPSDYINGLATDPAGYFIFATGSFTDACTFGTTTLNATYGDAFTLKLANNGNVEWAQQIGGTDLDAGNAVAVNKDGEVFTCGTFDGTCNFNFGSSSGYNLTTNGGNDIFIQKVAGCSGTVDTTVAVSGATLTANVSGAVYQWFNCNTNSYVPGASGKIFTATTSGSYSVMVIQNGCERMSGCRSVIGTSVAGVQKAATAIYPNPTNENINIQLDKSYDKVEVAITSAMGTLISKTIYSNALSISTRINGADGIYFISVTAGGETIARQKLVKTN